VRHGAVRQPHRAVMQVLPIIGSLDFLRCLLHGGSTLASKAAGGPANGRAPPRGCSSVRGRKVGMARSGCWAEPDKQRAVLGPRCPPVPILGAQNTGSPTQRNEPDVSWRHCVRAARIRERMETKGRVASAGGRPHWPAEQVCAMGREVVADFPTCVIERTIKAKCWVQGWQAACSVR